MSAPFYYANSNKINYHAAGRFYGVGPDTIKKWLKWNPPIDFPDQMPAWIEQWRRERMLAAHATLNARWIDINRPLREAAVELYCRQGMGLKVIRKELGLNSREKVRLLLVSAGVYQHGKNTITYDQAAERAKDKAEKANAQMAETRQRCTICLRGLRAGTGVKTTCRQNGWRPSSVWHYLITTRGYKLFLKRNKRQPTPRDQNTRHYQLSQKYPKEKLFVATIIDMINHAQLDYACEVSIPTSRTKCDLLVGPLLIECKVSVEAGALNEALGQALIYRTHTHHDVAIVLPDDLRERIAWTEAAAKIGVRFILERDLPEVFRRIRENSLMDAPVEGKCLESVGMTYDAPRSYPVKESFNVSR